MKKKQQEQDPGAPPWMVTYGDMVTLLLCFFVLMLSYASMDEIKFASAAISLQGALGVMQEQGQVSQMRASNQFDSPVIQTTSLIQRMNQLEAAIIELELEDDIDIQFNEKGTLLRMDDRILFQSGKAELKSEAYEVFKKLSGIFHSAASDILVSGHTDNIPIHNEEFSSNWDLSVARALSVVKAMIDLGVPEEVLGVVGYGEYRPVKSNDTAEGRRKNRRVEFLVSWK